tara:strand:- start:1753 stop:2586 length:834 start_codon:yes stop_codon:yes gene_type:complete
MSKTSEIKEILEGSYDLHVHAAPDTQDRRMDALETVKYAYESQMGGFVLKSHEYSTAPLADLLDKIYPGIHVFGAIALNKEVGGVNPIAAETSAKLGAKVIWMPTFSAHHWVQKDSNAKGLRIFDDNEKLSNETIEVIEIIAEHDILLASGHVSPPEVKALFEEAKKRGVKKMIATHPYQIMSLDEQKYLTELGVYIEYTFQTCMPNINTLSIKGLIEILNILGTENCVITTDFGQWMNPTPAEGMRMVISLLLEAGLEAEKISEVVKENPKTLLGI